MFAVELLVLTRNIDILTAAETNAPGSTKGEGLDCPSPWETGSTDLL